MKLSLVVLSEGKAKGHTIPITLSQFIIGRDAQCHLRPASALISKRHCAILVKNGKVFVRDFDSTNGTSVNNEPLKGERQLNGEDLLKVGPLEFRVKMEATTPVNKPTPPPKKLEVNEDDDVAAMLLSLQDDSSAGSVPTSEGDAVPDGTTMMELPRPPDVAAETGKEGDKPAEKKPDAKKQNADTSAAARAILEKYNRRTR